jgi:hypothetical protein
MRVKLSYVSGLLILLSASPSFGSITVLPQALTFADQPVGTTSAPQRVTLTFTSPDVVPSLELLGLYPHFDVRPMACTPLSSTVTSCPFDVVFKPTTAGSKTVTLTIKPFSNISVPPIATVNLSGTAIAVVPPDPLSGFQKFQAIGNAVDDSARTDVCTDSPSLPYTGGPTDSFMFNGALQGDVLGRGTYQLCIWRVAGVSYAGGTTIAGSSSAYLLFTSDSDGSAFRITINFIDTSITFATWALDSTKSTGRFASQLLDASGTFELNTHAIYNNGSVINSGTLVLNGVLVINAPTADSAPPATQ